MFRTDFDFNNRWLIRDVTEYDNTLYTISTTDLGLDNGEPYLTMVFKLDENGEVIPKPVLSKEYSSRQEAEEYHNLIKNSISEVIANSI